MRDTNCRYREEVGPFVTAAAVVRTSKLGAQAFHGLDELVTESVIALRVTFSFRRSRKHANFGCY